MVDTGQVRKSKTNRHNVFISKNDVSQDCCKDITYGQIMCDYREGNVEPNQTQLTVRGDEINYPDDCGTPLADLLMVKLLLNSVVSTLDVKFMTIDLKNFYLNMPLKGTSISVSNWTKF